MAIRRHKPYIWATWLSPLLVGEKSCEWAGWFRAQHEGKSWERAGNGFDTTRWLTNHTEALEFHRTRWTQQGYDVTLEEQNRFLLEGKTVTLAGKPDLIASKGSKGTVVDVKTGKPNPAHAAQVMIYMYLIPRALGRYNGILLDGGVEYADHRLDIPGSAVDSEFVSKLVQLILRLGATEPARQVPSLRECRFCDITSADCSMRLDSHTCPTATTTVF